MASREIVTQEFLLFFSSSDFTEVLVLKRSFEENRETFNLGLAKIRPTNGFNVIFIDFFSGEKREGIHVNGYRKRSEVLIRLYAMHARITFAWGTHLPEGCVRDVV